MKIKKQFIGAKVKSQLVNTYFIIEEGKEDLYLKLGLLHIFEFSESRIKIIKKDAKTGKKSE